MHIVSNFLIDTNEPVGVFAAVKPVLDNVRVTSLNVDGYADYKWDTANGKTKQCERKTWGELLSNLDKVEEQLQRHLTKHPQIELVFMLEGIVHQTNTGTQVLNKQSNGFVTKGMEYRSRLSGIFAWLYEIGKYCEVIQTTSLQESCVALCSLYNADQKLNHNTLHRHIKQLNFNTDPRITTLMGVSPGLGEVRAGALINQFSTPWNILSAGWKGEPVVKNKYDLTIVNGIGKTLVDNVLRNFGRPDID